MMRSAITIAAVAAASAVAVAQPAAPGDDGWLALDAVGVSVEVPAPFVAEGEPPIVLTDPRGADIARYPSGIDRVRFAVAAIEAGRERPHDIAAAMHDPVEAPAVTYEVDERELGVVSGHDGPLIFYSACKRRDARIACFSLSYPARYRALVDPTIERILRSLR